MYRYLVLGIGCGIVSVPPVICVQYYFKKKRPFALGTSLAGHSIGTFLFMPIIQFLIDVYGWRGAILFHAGKVRITILFETYG